MTEPTFPVETRVESAKTSASRAEFFLDCAAKEREHGDYAEEQRNLRLAAQNYEAAAAQVRGAIAQSKTDEDYANRRV